VSLEEIKKVFPGARAQTVTRHSRDLVRAIELVRMRVADAHEVIENGKWFIKGTGVTMGPFDTQWEAWMTAKDWDVEGSLGESNPQ